MDINLISPELQKAARRLPALPLDRRWALMLMRLLLKLGSMRRGNTDGVTVKDVQLSNRKIRVYTPDGVVSGAGVLWIHGGGLIVGAYNINDDICARYAKAFNAVVVSVGYRLAPEHTYPAASDDLFEGWLWFLDHAEELGVDQNRIAVGGQSAGGGLTAHLCQRILDHGGTQPVAQLLWYPMLDDRTAANTELDAIKHLSWNNTHNRFGWSSYLGCEAGSDNVPDNAVPARRENLAGLPPAWIGIGTIDLFYQECIDYAERLREAGVDTVVDSVPGGFHGFETIAAKKKLSKDFIQRHFDYARNALKENRVPEQR